MTKHLADKRTPSEGGRTRHFLRIARQGRSLWHRTEALPQGNRRLMEFLRIARGRLA